jgi:hypothetical protein
MTKSSGSLCVQFSWRGVARDRCRPTDPIRSMDLNLPDRGGAPQSDQRAELANSRRPREKALSAACDDFDTKPIEFDRPLRQDRAGAGSRSERVKLKPTPQDVRVRIQRFASPIRRDVSGRSSLYPNADSSAAFASIAAVVGAVSPLRMWCASWRMRPAGAQERSSIKCSASGLRMMVQRSFSCKMPRRCHSRMQRLTFSRVAPTISANSCWESESLGGPCPCAG